MTKFERIRLVGALGLNTEEDILVRSAEDWSRSADWLDRFDKYTVRTFRLGARNGTEPYFAVIQRDDFDKYRSHLLSEGWQLIVAAPVDPQYAEFAGTVLRNGAETEVQIVRGPGATVRRVTHEGYVDETCRVVGRRPTGDPKVDAILNQIYEVEDRFSQFPELQHVIYEVSYYRTEVGHKKEHAIFWEITGIDKMDPGIDRAMVRSDQS
jgi:hypothetical protein